MDRIDRLIAKLESNDRHERAKALKALSVYDDPRIIKPLLRMCFDSDVAIKYQARKLLQIVRERFAERASEFDNNLRSSFISLNFEQLKSENFLIRINAIKRLTQLKEISVFDELCVHLKKEKDKRVIATLLLAIAKHGASKAIPVIKPYLKSEDNRIRANAVEAIGNIDVLEKVKILQPYLNDEDNRVKGNAAIALWKYSKVKVLDILRKMLKSSKEKEQKSAIYALSEIGSIEARQLLLSVKSDVKLSHAVNIAIEKVDNTLAQSIGESLSKEDLKEVEKELNITKEDRMSKLERVFKRRGSGFQERLYAVCAFEEHVEHDMVDFLVELLNTEKDKYVISALVKIIGKTGAKSAIPVLLPYLKDEDSRVRANTIEGLMHIKDDRVFTAIVPLLNDEDNRVKANAASVLYRVYPDKVFSELINMLRSGDPWVVNSAIFALQEIGTEEAEELLQELLDHINIEIRGRAAEALEVINHRKMLSSKIFVDKLVVATEVDEEEISIENVEKVLNSPSWLKRVRAVGFIEELKDPEKMPLLISRLEVEKDFQVLVRLIKAIGSFRSLEIIKHIAPFLLHDNLAVKRAALEVLLEYPADDVLNSIKLRLVDEYGVYKTKSIFVLWYFNRKEATNEIKKLVNSPKVVDRHLAITILSEIDDPEIKEYLETLERDVDTEIASRALTALNNMERDIYLKIKKILHASKLDISVLSKSFTYKYRRYLIEYLVRILRKSDPDNRKSILNQLESLVSFETIEVFGEILLKEQDKYVKAMLITVVGSLKHAACVPILEGFLRDVDSRVRANTIEALTGISEPLVFDLVVPLLYDSDERCRNNALELLKLFGDRFYDKLEEMLLNKNEKRSIRELLRKSAEEALLKLGTERAEEILNKGNELKEEELKIEAEKEEKKRVLKEEAEKKSTVIVYAGIVLIILFVGLHFYFYMLEEGKKRSFDIARKYYRQKYREILKKNKDFKTLSSREGTSSLPVLRKEVTYKDYQERALIDATAFAEEMGLTADNASEIIAHSITPPQELLKAEMFIEKNYLNEAEEILTRLNTTVSEKDILLKLRIVSGLLRVYRRKKLAGKYAMLYKEYERLRYNSMKFYANGRPVKFVSEFNVYTQGVDLSTEQGFNTALSRYMTALKKMNCSSEELSFSKKVFEMMFRN